MKNLKLIFLTSIYLSISNIQMGFAQEQEQVQIQTTLSQNESVTLTSRDRDKIAWLANIHKKAENKPPFYFEATLRVAMNEFLNPTLPPSLPQHPLDSFKQYKPVVTNAIEAAQEVRKTILEANQRALHADASASNPSDMNAFLSDLSNIPNSSRTKAIIISAKYGHKFLISPDKSDQTHALHTLSRYQNAASDSVASNQILLKSYELAENNSDYREVLNALVAAEIGAKTTDTAEDIYKKNPSLLSDKNIQQVLEISNKSIVTNKDIQNAQKTLLSSTENLTNQVNELFNLAKEAEENKALEQERLARQEKIEVVAQNLKMSSALLGTITARFIDPKLGKTIEAVGTIASDMYRISELIKIGKLTSDVGLAATGNFIGIAFSMIDLFNDTPSADQQMMEMLQNISQQLESMSKQLNERFDRIDQALAEIYFSVHKQFKYLNERLDYLSQDINNILEILREQRQIAYALQNSLDRHALSQAKYDLNEMLKECLKFQNYIVVKNLNTKDFISCYIKIAHAATEFPQLSFASDRRNNNRSNQIDFLNFNPYENMNLISNQLSLVTNRDIPSGLQNPILFSEIANVYIDFINFNWKRFGSFLNFSSLALDSREYKDGNIPTIDQLLRTTDKFKSFFRTMTANNGLAIQNQIKAYRHSTDVFFHAISDVLSRYEREKTNNHKIVINKTPPNSMYEIIENEHQKTIGGCPYTKNEAAKNLPIIYKLPENYSKTFTSLMKSTAQLQTVTINVCISDINWVNVQEYTETNPSDNQFHNDYSKFSSLIGLGLYKSLGENPNGWWKEFRGNLKITIDTYAKQADKKEYLPLESRSYVDSLLNLYEVWPLAPETQTIGFAVKTKNLVEVLKEDWSSGRNIQTSFISDSTTVVENKDSIKELATIFVDKMNQTIESFEATFYLELSRGTLLTLSKDLDRNLNILKSFIKFSLPKTYAENAVLRSYFEDSTKHFDSEILSNAILQRIQNLNKDNESNTVDSISTLLDGIKKSTSVNFDEMEKVVLKVISNAKETDFRNEKTEYIENIQEQLNLIKQRQEQMKPKMGIEESLEKMKSAIEEFNKNKKKVFY